MVAKRAACRYHFTRTSLELSEILRCQAPAADLSKAALDELAAELFRCIGQRCPSMTNASRRRRRLFGGFFLLSGLVLLTFGDLSIRPSMVWKSKLLGPCAALYGLGGLVYPPSVPDPKPEGGVVAAVSLSGSRRYAIGFVLGCIGLAIGAYLAFVE